MNKKKLALVLVILLVLAGIWLYRNCANGGSSEQTAQNGSWLSEIEGTVGDVAIPNGVDGEEPAQPAQTEPPALADLGDAAQGSAEEGEESEPQTQEAPALDENGAYTTKEDIAAYLALYGRLPENFITKQEARTLGWSGGGLDEYAYGKCIGGDRFGNNEGLLPEKTGRRYTECDVNTLHRKSRGAERIVYSNDGLIYYTSDHYSSFTLLYGEP